MMNGGLAIDKEKEYKVVDPCPTPGPYKVVTTNSTKLLESILNENKNTIEIIKLSTCSILKPVGVIKYTVIYRIWK